MSIAQFFPTDTVGWTCFACAIVLLITLLLMNKGVLKCKESIEDYISEIRQLKLYNSELYRAIRYASDNSTAIQEFANTIDLSETEFLKYCEDKNKW